MTTRAASRTFIHLKYFPRDSRNGLNTDDGSFVSTNYQPKCTECGGVVRETISLEFCTECGHVVVDYWGGLGDAK